MLRALPRCIVPGDLHHLPPTRPAPDQPLRNDLPPFVALATERSCPQSRYVDGARLSRPPCGLHIPPALGGSSLDPSMRRSRSADSFCLTGTKPSRHNFT
ncbi:hypothetical protein MTO96_039239 [Rhipicephalus appendiculatus]